MKNDNITIKDIAKALNLSYSTVSRALKGSYKISEGTQQLVKEYAATHNYRPNLMAQSLKNQKSRCIGVVLCSIPNSFFAEVISGIESIAYNKDYLLIITQNLESYEREVKNLDNLTWRSVDGLLVSLSTETEDISHFQRLHDQGLPMVFFDRVTDAIPTHQVITDNIGGAFDATKHLIERGYKRIATITSSPFLSITRERLEGYKKALTEHNMPVNDDHIQYCPHGGMVIEEIDSALNNLLQLNEPPDAILTASDRITIGSFSLIQRKGLLIPDEIAVAGFSNFNAPELFNPPLTTVRQNAFEMGKQATELLIQLVESKRPVTSFEKKVLPTELIVRKST
ncbi:LacI family transcriptional regulator [Niastella caeni]|uniref:LacI family transcriptional regulator n=1 Tax=Niastella caeni TaxID=2569763 RepID=A0A4S8HY09_9BACT|nr:LacI family DNA-binding transcriptional regulator [Niastella caeni]THU39689.1 LacI family transcriptional regulator [Niastella caeni]